MPIRAEGQESPQTSGWGKIGCILFPLSCSGLLIVLILLIAMVPSVLKFGGERLAQNPFGTAPGSGGGGSAVDCSGVASVPANYKPWVKEAADKWLGGDEAALIALIQVESAWKATAKNSTSSATGLGQFTYGTASGVWNGRKVGKGMPEFIGGSDGRGRTWSAGVVTNPASDNDARLDPERAIFATAHLFSTQLARYGNVREAYERGYHTYSNAEQERAAKAAGARLQGIYDKIRQEGCQQVGPSGPAAPETGATQTGERIASIAEGLIGTTTAIDPKTGENVFNCNAATRSCASFVSTVLQRAGVTNRFEASTTGLWNNSGGSIVIPRGGLLVLAKLQRGDVIWFGDGIAARARGNNGAQFDHVGIYVGNGTIVDTSSSTKQVVKRSIQTHRFMAAKRFGGNVTAQLPPSLARLSEVAIIKEMYE
jgi:cell wall-associated NlpC family hydrolase